MEQKETQDNLILPHAETFYDSLRDTDRFSWVGIIRHTDLFNRERMKFLLTENPEAQSRIAVNRTFDPLAEALQRYNIRADLYLSTGKMTNDRLKNHLKRMETHIDAAHRSRDVSLGYQEFLIDSDLADRTGDHIVNGLALQGIVSDEAAIKAYITACASHPDIEEMGFILASSEAQKRLQIYVDLAYHETLEPEGPMAVFDYLDEKTDLLHNTFAGQLAVDYHYAAIQQRPVWEILDRAEESAQENNRVLSLFHVDSLRRPM